MKHTLTEDGDIIHIQLEGDIIGGPDARALNDKMRDLVKQKKNKIILDLSQVALINSSGLGILISALTTARKSDGDLLLVNIADRIRNLLTIAKLDTVFKVFDTFEQAKAHFQQK